MVDDFTWISVASFYPFMICVKADLRFQNLAQLIDEARHKPGQFKYGSGGVGSILHTTVELMGHRDRHEVPGCALSRGGAGVDRPAYPATSTSSRRPLAASVRA